MGVCRPAASPGQGLAISIQLGGWEPGAACHCWLPVVRCRSGSLHAQRSHCCGSLAAPAHPRRKQSFPAEALQLAGSFATWHPPPHLHRNLTWHTQISAVCTAIACLMHGRHAAAVVCVILQRGGDAAGVCVCRIEPGAVRPRGAAVQQSRLDRRCRAQPLLQGRSLAGTVVGGAPPPPPPAPTLARMHHATHAPLVADAGAVKGCRVRLRTGPIPLVLESAGLGVRMCVCAGGARASE